MSSEERGKAEPCPGTFSGCLVESDPETIERAGKIKRRAVALSVVLQTAALAMFVIAPLFARQPELLGRKMVPIPPFGSHPAQRRTSLTPHGTTRLRCVFCRETPALATGRVVRGSAPTTDGIDDLDLPNSGEIDLSLLIPDNRVQPPPPPPETKKRVHESHIDPALLTRRIEPVFPALAKQTRRSGKVELHALIGTDGSVESLDVVSGDPWFIESALEAVRQWHYRPTYLNGQAVEVDTYITVIYTLQ